MNRFIQSTVPLHTHHHKLICHSLKPTVTVTQCPTSEESTGNSHCLSHVHKITSPSSPSSGCLDLNRTHFTLILKEAYLINNTLLVKYSVRKYMATEKFKLFQNRQAKECHTQYKLFLLVWRSICCMYKAHKWRLQALTTYWTLLREQERASAVKSCEHYLRL